MCAMLEGRPEPPQERHSSFAVDAGSLVMNEASMIAGGMSGVLMDATAHIKRRVFRSNSATSKNDAKDESKLFALKQV